MSDIDPQALDGLRSAVARDPGDPDYPVLAELLRRAGRLDEAEAVVTAGLLAAPESLAGRCALLLILEDRGRREQLRGRLEAWVEEAVRGRLPEGAAGPGTAVSEVGAEPGEAPPGLSEDELDRAFASAEPAVDEMLTPDSVAEAATLRVDGDDAAAEADPAAHSPFEESPTFATHTMAELLERQGDAAGAARIRAALGGRSAGPERSAEPRADRAGSRSGGLLVTLERWLANARRLQA